MSRNEANTLRLALIKKKGNKVVDHHLKSVIKRYSRNTFGSTSYWPWLALYTEMRGEFLEGWIPDDVYRFEILPKLNPKKFASLSEAKTIDHELFPRKTIEPLLIRMQGIYMDKEKNVLDKQQVREILSDLDCEIVIKPDDGRQGDGILFMKTGDVNLEKLPASSDLVFQKVVKQHDSLSEINPNSVNTFRVYTHFKSGGEVIVKFILLRMGRGENRVDNTAGGGIWVQITKNGNAVGNAIDELGYEIGGAHPDTGYVFENISFRFINKITTLCKSCHKSYPYVGLIGWDIYVNELGSPYIIEWNANNPGYREVEALRGPLWSMDKIINR